MDRKAGPSIHPRRVEDEATVRHEWRRVLQKHTNLKQCARDGVLGVPDISFLRFPIAVGVEVMRIGTVVIGQFY